MAVSGVNPTNANPNAITPDFIPADESPDFIPVQGQDNGAPKSAPKVAPKAAPTADAGPHDPSLWEQANTGLISPEQIAQPGEIGKKLGLADYSTLKNERDYLDPNESPIHAAVRRGLAGAGVDAADTLSSFTSPLSLATAGLTRWAKSAGAMGKIARAILTTQGVGMGVKGAADMSEALSNENNPNDSVLTPENSKKYLLGASQVTGAVPAVQGVARGVKSIGSKLAPSAYSQGEEAFVRAMNPPKRGNEANILRQAYRNVAPDLENSGAKNFEDLQSYANRKKLETAAETNRRLALSSPGAPPIDPNAVEAAVRNGVTDLMDVEATNKTVPTGVLNAQGQPIMTNQKILPQRAQNIIAYARNVGENLARSPKGLVEAEQLVQDINAEAHNYQRMSPDAQRQADAEGNPMAAKLALKDELQRQIENTVGNYKDLKQRYGAFKEIEKNSARRLNEIETKPVVSNTLRRGLEYAGAGVGAFLGAHGGPVEGGVGAALGGLGAHAAADFYAEHLASPDRLLRRGMQPPKATSSGNFNGALPQAIASSVGQADENSRAHAVPGPIRGAAGIPSGPQIRVISPDGQTGSIPQDDLPRALKQGYRRLQ